MKDIRLPMVEIYETVEGEGSRSGYPTVFVRLFGCNLRCVWCDTPYSYPPAEAEGSMTITEIVEQVNRYGADHVCVTGGEPLLYGERSMALLEALGRIERLADIHVETNGAIDLAPFLTGIDCPKVRYVMDYKLPGSGEEESMLLSNLSLLRGQDELKFVIAGEEDFEHAVKVLENDPVQASVLFSPVWETMPPAKLAELMLARRLNGVRLSLQLHKLIWEPSRRGV